MNCRPGDLAIVVRSDAGNEGRIVRCLKASRGFWLSPKGAIEEVDEWEIDVQLRGWAGDWGNVIADDQLRPLRDPGDDARDEMLRPLPQEVTA